MIHDIRYQPDEAPPLPLTLALGLQYALLAVTAIIIVPSMMIRLGGQGEAYLSWAVFAALIISSLTTLIQVVRVGRFGAGYILLMGSTSTFLVVCVPALEQGGPSLLAPLIVVSSLFQFALSAQLSLLRSVFTPTVAGTVLILLPITIGPLIMRMLHDVPDDTAPEAAPITASTTLLVLVALVVRGVGLWRLWAPVIALSIGSVVGGVWFGLYDTARVADAAWLGWPTLFYPGFDLRFGADFWALLPAFVMVTFVGALDTIGDTIAMQRTAWRRPRAIDFRAIQGSLNADGLGNLLSGLAGTVPNSTYSLSSSVAQITGIASRVVGMSVAGFFFLFALLPKLIAAVLAIPSPVVGAYLVVLVAVLFVTGLRILTQDGLDYRTGVIVGFSFWVGVAVHFGWLFPDVVQEGTWGVLFSNGVTVGGLLVMLLTAFVRLTSARPQRLTTTVHPDAQPQIDAFLVQFAARRGWDTPLTNRLRGAGEEALQVLLQAPPRGMRQPERKLLLIARADEAAIILEFLVAAETTNIEDQLTLLGDQAAETPDEEEFSLRLLRHHATSVRHQQFHDTDVLLVRVEPQAEVAAESA